VLLFKWKEINNFKELLRFIFNSQNMIKTIIITLSIFFNLLGFNSPPFRAVQFIPKIR
jgi:hypothetical protein